ncbi:MAG TPA: zinc ABC transporter substrate-binding protein, partial [Deinococcales bacterium]|nr:zinc ABC transporter substrate-binding protein [Deinococcales bacterium]
MRLLRIPLALLAAWLFPVALAAPLTVVASFSIIGNLAATVGGPGVKVVTLAPPNVDPHEFQPGTAVTRQASGARVAFLNGLGLDDWALPLLNSVAPQAALVRLAAGIKPRLRPGLPPDPHAWWDLRNARVYVNAIRDALKKADPGHAAAYASRAAALDGQLARLDAWALKTLSAIPAAKRVMVTNHDAFGYLAARYGLKVVATVFPGDATETEPTARETAALIDTLKKSGARVIFTENTLPPRLAETIAAETGVKVAPGLYSDALGAPG